MGQKKFVQEALKITRCAFLDTTRILYVWLGEESPEDMKKWAMEVAPEYVNLVVSEGGEKREVIVINQGNEPLLFTSYFQAWVLVLARGSLPNEKVGSF